MRYAAEARLLSALEADLGKWSGPVRMREWGVLD